MDEDNKRRLQCNSVGHSMYRIIFCCIVVYEKGPKKGHSSLFRSYTIKFV